MSSRPIIGIPTQSLQSLGGLPADIPPSWAMSQRYITALTAVGAVPWMVPLLADDEGTMRAIYDELDGVFLPGGADIDPASYGEDRHPRCDRGDASRDRIELMLIRWAIPDRKPVLGICRGVQLINLAYGGTLYQDLADQREGSIKHDYFPFGGAYRREHLAHSVSLREGSRLHEILGTNELEVNSMHHQGIRSLGRGLVPTAIAPDGLVEAAEAEDGRFMIGVQWHPEVFSDRDARTTRLFSAFIAAAGEFRQARSMAGSAS